MKPGDCGTTAGDIRIESKSNEYAHNKLHMRITDWGLISNILDALCPLVIIFFEYVSEELDSTYTFAHIWAIITTMPFYYFSTTL